MVFYPNIVLAEELNLPKTSITPDNYLFYSIKRLWEKTVVFSKFSKQSKADYYRELTLTRIAELKNVSEQKYLSDVQQATQRISYQVGTLTDYIVSNKTDLEKTIPNTKEFLNNSKSTLINIRDTYYPESSSFRMLVEHSINSIDLNLEKLK